LTQRPNILWIMTDQHRADCLGCMGHPVIQTPHLDRIGAEGIVFENAFCQSPVCMASRAALFTGRYPATVRVRGMGVLPPAETTFPELLRRAGYSTGAFGKVHLTPERYTRDQLGSDVPILDWRAFAPEAVLPPFPDDPVKESYGFDTHIGCDDANQGNFRAWLRERCPELADKPRGTPEPGWLPDQFVSPFPTKWHQSTYISQTAEAFIRQQDRSAPWFTFCSFIAPHHPFEAPADQLARYSLADIPAPEWHGGTDGAFIPDPAANAVDEALRYAPDVLRRLMLHYLASISCIDDGVGRLLTALEETDQLDNTIIVFVSDHGEFAGNHGLLRKPSIHYDELLRVPLLLRLPTGRGGGRRVPGMVESIDVHPTLLGLLGMDVNPGVQGIDWSASIVDGHPIARDDIHSDMHDLGPMAHGQPNGPYCAVQTLRTNEWKLNIYPTAGPEYGQLFNLRDDPGEETNLYGDSSCRATREDMLWRLLQRIHTNIDPLPIRLSQW